jgi:hypothetical protein
MFDLGDAKITNRKPIRKENRIKEEELRIPAVK